MTKNIPSWIALGLGAIALALMIGVFVNSNVGTLPRGGYYPESKERGACILSNFDVLLNTTFRSCDNDPNYQAFCQVDSERAAFENIDNPAVCYRNPNLTELPSQPDSEEVGCDPATDPTCITLPEEDFVPLEEVGNCLMIDQSTVIPNLTLDSCAASYPTDWYLWCEQNLYIGHPGCFINPLYVAGPPELPEEERPPVQDGGGSPFQE